jgi:hypothetical protein
MSNAGVILDVVVGKFRFRPPPAELILIADGVPKHCSYNFRNSECLIRYNLIEEGVGNRRAVAFTRIEA